MAFLLSIDHQDDGFTRLTYDIGPSQRLNLVVATAMAHEALGIPADTLLGRALATQRLTTSEEWQRV